MSDVKTPPRRLVDLNPKWVVVHGTGEIYGIGYDCPCGLTSCSSGGREVVPTKTNFAGAPSCADSAVRGWDLTGDSFENITLTPSIHQVGHWHGWLTNGVLVSC